MGLRFKIKVCLVGLLFSTLCFAADPLFRPEEAEAIREILSWVEGTENGKPRFPSSEYFILGVGGSPGVIVDVRNTISPDSAASLPFSGARNTATQHFGNVRAALRGYYEPQVAEEKYAEWLKDKRVAYGSALPQHLRTQFEENLKQAIGNKLKGRKLLVVDLTVDGAALMMAKENIAAALPGVEVQGLALDARGTFVPPDSSYKVFPLTTGFLTRAENALSSAKFYSPVAGWDTSTGRMSDPYSRMELAKRRGDRYENWIGDMIVSTPALIDAHWRGVGCEVMFKPPSQGLAP